MFCKLFGTRTESRLSGYANGLSDSEFTCDRWVKASPYALWNGGLHHYMRYIQVIVYGIVHDRDLWIHQHSDTSTSVAQVPDIGGSSLNRQSRSMNRSTLLSPEGAYFGCRCPILITGLGFSVVMNGLDGIMDLLEEVHDWNGWQFKEDVETLWHRHIYVIQGLYSHLSQWNQKLLWPVPVWFDAIKVHQELLYWWVPENVGKRYDLLIDEDGLRMLGLHACNTRMDLPVLQVSGAYLLTFQWTSNVTNLWPPPVPSRHYRCDPINSRHLGTVLLAPAGRSYWDKRHLRFSKWENWSPRLASRDFGDAWPSAPLEM